LFRYFVYLYFTKQLNPMLSGSNETIRSWHPGDRDVEDMERWRRENPELARQLVASYESARPGSNAFPGSVLVFGTAGDMEAGDLQNFFTKPDGYVVGIDPYRHDAEVSSAVIKYFTPSCK
jgi:hypothetical protein